MSEISRYFHNAPFILEILEFSSFFMLYNKHFPKLHEAGWVTFVEWRISTTTCFLGFIVFC